MRLVMRLVRAGCALIVLGTMLVLAAPAAAQQGKQTLRYKVGPFNITPGQNRIDFAPIDAKPQVDGYITRIKPDLIYTNGKVPRVDILHLHHGVWLNLSRSDSTLPGLPERFFAAGEEKTIFTMPKGYGYAYRASDRWLLNHMIHNLITRPAQVYMTYEIDFIPASSPAARNMKPVRPVWMDVENGHTYPVFDVQKDSGRGGRYTYPDQARDPYPGRPENEWTVDRDGVLVATAGHLHPGGLWTDLRLRREGARVRRASCGKLRASKARRRCRRNAPRGRGNTAHLFRSIAKYHEPAGAVSWDVSMTATRRDWKVKVKQGDVLSVSSTYDTRRGAWYESMGIMVVYMADEGPGRNPFARRVNHPGNVTHGHLAENDNHGGRATELPDPRRLPDGVLSPDGISVNGFTYALGDLRLPGERGRPPVVKRGQSLLFTLSQQDNSREIYHSITSCKPPCNRSTGIAYPLADGRFQFDSGQLGTRQVPPAIGRVTWNTPATLPKGTYTYFCRIHPFMRGAFRVKD
jgi:hypothetical protein